MWIVNILPCLDVDARLPKARLVLLEHHGDRLQFALCELQLRHLGRGMWGRGYLSGYEGQSFTYQGTQY